MQIHWIWLAHRPGLNDRTKRLLLERFHDPEQIFYAESSAFDAIEELTGEGKLALSDKDLTAAEQILADCRREGLRLLTWQDAAYPRALRSIDDPPVLLYYKGTLPDFEGNPVIAVVGTRRASSYGLTTAKRMGYQIARCGGIVVSGMAFGIDSMAMSGALTAGGTVVGVLGCGADIVYPASNGALFRDTEKFGCILSEFAPGQQPAKWTFPKRNRIISGLSSGVLVVEAPEKSGSLITARLAGEQGRDVFVVPGNIDQPGFVGSNRLLREGAIAVSSGWDVLSEYRSCYPDKIRREEDAVHLTAYPDEVVRAAEKADIPPQKVAQKPAKPRKEKHLKKDLEKKPIDKEPAGAYSDVNVDLTGLPADGLLVVNALHGGERQVDEVIAETGMSTGRFLAAMTILEVRGVIRRLPGKRISIVTKRSS